MRQKFFLYAVIAVLFLVFISGILIQSNTVMILGGAGAFTLLLSLFILGRDKTHKILINILILELTLLILLVCGEFFVRYFFRNITTTGDNTSYFAQKWKKNNVSLNSWRFREREFNLAKKGSGYRIAIIGDSFTFGQGIKVRYRFSNLIENDLNNEYPERKYEVLNFGKPGAETIDHLSILKNIVLKIEPDFILLQWYVNDFEGHDKRYRPKIIPIAISPWLHRYFNRRSALYYLINNQWMTIQMSLGKNDYTQYMIKRFKDPGGLASREVEKSLQEFIRLCRENNIPLGIVLFPQFGPHLQHNYPFEFLHKRVISLCAKENVSYLDLRSVFTSYNYKDLCVNRFDHHPNILANRIAAEAIMRKFKDLWKTGRAREENKTFQKNNPLMNGMIILTHKE